MPKKRSRPGFSVGGLRGRLWITIFSDATAVARALGLDIELPSDGDQHADPDWVLLKLLPWAEIWFDRAEGMKLLLPLEKLGHAKDLLACLSDRGVPLIDASGASLVWASPAWLDSAAELIRFGDVLGAAGFVRSDIDVIWTLPVATSRGSIH
jgi:hypothetical protein